LVAHVKIIPFSLGGRFMTSRWFCRIAVLAAVALPAVFGCNNQKAPPVPPSGVGGLAAPVAKSNRQPLIQLTERSGLLVVEYLHFRVNRNRPETHQMDQPDTGFQVITNLLKQPDAPFSRDWTQQRKLLSEAGHGGKITFVDQGVVREDSSRIARFTTKPLPGDPLKFHLRAEISGAFMYSLDTIGQSDVVLGIRNLNECYFDRKPTAHWSVFRVVEREPEVTQRNNTLEGYDVVVIRCLREDFPFMSSGGAGMPVEWPKTRVELAERMRATPKPKPKP
jgi:hypothetical protein